jgi:hypothetical protein
VHAWGDVSQRSVRTQRDYLRTPLLGTWVTTGKGKGWGPTSGAQPSFFALFTNDLEEAFSEVAPGLVTLHTGLR